MALVSLVLALSAPALAEPPFGGDGLVAYWPLDEEAGAEVVDHAGGDNSGAFTPGASPVRLTGPIGAGSLAFLSSGERVVGPDAGFPRGVEPGSISLWFNRPPEASDKVLFSYGPTVREAARGLWIVSDSRLCFYFWGHPQDLHVDIPGGVTPDEWHHVVGTYDGAVARLYYDGAQAGEVAVEIDTGLSGHYQIGGNLVANDGRDFLGLIDEIAVLDRALSAEEIGDYYGQHIDAVRSLPDEQRLAYHVEARRLQEERAALVRTRAEELGLDDIVFAVRQVDGDGHWYANFGYDVIHEDRRPYYHDGGRLCKLNVRTGEVATLLEDATGGVRDPQVHYDGQRVLFSYREGGQPYYRLYEIGVDGTGLRQLTDGPYDDFEPTYLPDGDIIFCSSRCNRWVPCYKTQVATLHRCGPDGGGIRPLSANAEQENTPWVLPDGRVLYQRWEYVDRSQVGYHHLWTMNPDGTEQTVYFGNMRANTVMIDAKPIPGTGKVVASFSPGHGRNEHEGAVTIVDPGGGPDAHAMARALNPDTRFRDPYPVSADCFLVARDAQIMLMDGEGRAAAVYELPADRRQGTMKVHEPRPLRPRPRERVIPSRVDVAAATGHVFLEDIHVGRNMAGVERGEIESLLVLEMLPKACNIFSGMEPLSYGGTFLLERIVGTVPVEEDGSAYFEAPALRALFFVALDRDGMAVKRMQSFMTVQPGESVGCVGCHEDRMTAPSATRGTLAMRRPPSAIEPIAGMPEVIDFPRDVQPILDRHCVACHDYNATEQGGPMAGGIILAGDRGPMYSHGYYALTIAGQVSHGRNLRRSNYPPRALGSSASPLLQKLDGSHQGARLTASERELLRLWIDTGAVYAGTYAALGTGSIGDYADGLDRSDLKWATTASARDAMERRCATCHEGPTRLPDSPSDNKGLVPWAEGPMNDLAKPESQRMNPHFRYNRHALYNLTRPSRSLILLAPLAQEAGGYGTCGEPVFADTTDPDYEAMLRSISEAATHLGTIKRFDMPGFRPRREFVRELVRYGLLPTGFESSTEALDVYQLERSYWRSLWHRPPTGD